MDNIQGSPQNSPNFNKPLDVSRPTNSDISGLGIKSVLEPKEALNKQIKGQIIVLTGIVASGKSSIVKAIQTLDPEYVEEDLDLRRDPTLETKPETELEMIDDTINRSLNGGKTVISLLKSNHLTRRMDERGISGVPVSTLLAHCPFSEIPGRLDARNNAAEGPGGDLGNWRDPLAPLDQFLELYTKSANGLEEIDRDQATEYFNTSFDKSVAHSKKMGTFDVSDEQLLLDKVIFCKEFLDKLGFTDDTQKITVAPRAHFDEVIDTSTCRDPQSREAVVSKIFQNHFKS